MMPEYSAIKQKCSASYFLLVYLLLNKNTQGEYILRVLIP